MLWFLRDKAYRCHICAAGTISVKTCLAPTYSRPLQNPKPPASESRSCHPIGGHGGAWWDITTCPAKGRFLDISSVVVLTHSSNWFCFSVLLINPKAGRSRSCPTTQLVSLRGHLENLGFKSYTTHFQSFHQFLRGRLAADQLADGLNHRPTVRLRRIGVQFWGTRAWPCQRSVGRRCCRPISWCAVRWAGVGRWSKLSAETNLGSAEILKVEEPWSSVQTFKNDSWFFLVLFEWYYSWKRPQQCVQFGLPSHRSWSWWSKGTWGFDVKMSPETRWGSPMGLASGS